MPVISPPTVPCPGKTMARSIPPLKLDPVQVRSPGQAKPEADGNDVLSRLERVVDVGVGERDARRRGIPEPVEVDHDPVLGYLHLPYRGSYYACICLVGYDVLDLIRRESVAGEKLLDHVGQYPDGELEDLAAVLVELFVACRVAGAPEWGSPSVGPEDVVYKTRVPVAGVEYDGAGAVAEKDGRRSIFGVDDSTHCVRPDEQDPCCGAGVDRGGSGGGGGREPGTRRGEVQRAGGWGADLLCGRASG